MCLGKRSWCETFIVYTVATYLDEEETVSLRTRLQILVYFCLFIK